MTSDIEKLDMVSSPPAERVSLPDADARLAPIKRKHISPTKRLEILLRHNGRCDICGGRIDGKAWDVSHRRPLAMGGADDESNWFPAHRVCHQAETREKDIPDIAKAKRRQLRHNGIRKRSKFPCSKDSPYRKKIDGTVERR